MSTQNLVVENGNENFSIDKMENEFERLNSACPDFQSTQILDDQRRNEYARLDDNQQIYLDYTGGGLYAKTQLEKHMKLLENNVLGNPHSANPTSLAMTDLVEETRKYVLKYFKTNPNEYIAVFTANASGALKLVGEAFPFAEGGKYALTYDNHNSVNGIRLFAQQKGAAVEYVPLTTPDLRMNENALENVLNQADSSQENLFAFPAQSNFSGVKHDLGWIEKAQSKGWKVLLDAAAFVPANPLDLSQVKPDFVCISFYKMFGYPTGLGTLLIRRSAFPLLKRPWFAGGTVNFATVQGDSHNLANNEAAFEDGTINYLNIPAIKYGLQHIESIGMQVIRQRVLTLSNWLLQNLYDLKHSNGKPMVRIYGPIHTENRGGTITFNFYSPDSHLLDYRRIEELANEKGISLRTGCFCNPGAGEIAEGLTREDMKLAAEGGDEMSLPLFLKMIEHRGNKSAGAIRISVGIASNFSDVYRFMNYAASFKDQNNMNIGEATMDIMNCRVIRDGS